MTWLSTYEFFTADRVSEIESLLSEAVPAIGAEAAGSAGNPGLAAIYLGGGYGRGEGGVFRDAGGKPHPYNDLDFFVFTSKAPRRRRRGIDRAVASVAERWKEKLGIDVDFGPAKNVRALKREVRTLMFQELRHGYRQVWGERDVLAAFPALDAKEISPSEGARLLLNRGMGLLLAAERDVADPANAGFILRNLNKAVLGSADALLIAAQSYRYRAEERLAAFGTLAGKGGIAPERVREYGAALEFKARPDSRIPEDWDARWNAVREFWCESVAGVAGCRGEGSPNEVAAALGRNRKLRDGNGIANFLNWVRKTRSPGAVREWFEAPRLRMLGRLYRLLSLPGISRREAARREEGGRLRKMWKAIN